MKAIRFDVTIPRYISGKTLGKVIPGFLWGGQSCTYMVDIPKPEFPNDDWVSVRTLYGGICGSDMSAINLHASPYFSPLVSPSYTMGHENVGHIEALGAETVGWQTGERVVVEPTLWCVPRGFEDLCKFCARGEINRCERTSEGNLSPALGIGNSQDTGGSWSAYFLAHKSQLYRIPDRMSDENALMVEPFATGLHAVLESFPADGDKVLIIGAGTIGLCALAALRALGSQAEILMMARYPFQAEAAQKLGASKVILPGDDGDSYDEIANFTGARIYQPILGKRVVIGGVDLTYECAGSSNSLDDAMRLTRSGGQVVLLGMPGIAKGVDWSSIFVHELEIKGAYIYDHAESYQGKTWKTFDLAIDLMANGKIDLGWMVTHKFHLNDYKRALTMMGSRGENQAIKAVFEFQDGNNVK
jgi:L-iditol 2-dehydrogenase